VLVPYRGEQGSFPCVSATDALNGRGDTGVLEGAIVLVGTSAEGLFDLRSTPVQNLFPGVEIRANVIAGILDNRFPYKPPWA
jgi:adenylate cyclase